MATGLGVSSIQGHMAMAQGLWAGPMAMPLQIHTWSVSSSVTQAAGASQVEQMAPSSLSLGLGGAEGDKGGLQGH